MKKWLAIGFKAAVSGGLIWYLLTGIDANALVAQMADADGMLLALATVGLLLQFLIGGARWGQVLKGLEAPLPFWLTARLFLIGTFFNQALPGGNGGDAARMYLAYKQGLSVRHAINGVLIERIVTVLALVIMVDAIQPLFLPHLQPQMIPGTIIAIVTITVLAAFGIGLLVLLDRLPESLRRWKIVRGLGNLGADTRRVLFLPSCVFPTLGWSIAGHLNVSVCVFILAMGLSIEVTLLDCIVLIPPVLLILAVPISIGGWGVREGAMVWAFGLVGVPSEAALVLSLLSGVLALVASLPGGVVWLITRNRDETATMPSEGLAAIQEKHENA